MNKKLTILISVICMMVMGGAVQAKTFQVCTVDIPDGMTSDGKGPQPLLHFYNEVIKMASQKTGHSFELQFAPSLRCDKLFQEKRVDIVWPFIVVDKLETLAEGYQGVMPVYSMPFIMGGIYIFTRDEDPVLNSVEETYGMTVANARGYGLPPKAIDNPNLKVHLLNTNEQVAKILTSKRVDAAFIQTGWVPRLAKEKLLDGLHHGSVQNFWGGGFMLQGTQEGIIMSNVFNNAILELVNSGVYEKLMTGAPYYIPSYKP